MNSSSIRMTPLHDRHLLLGARMIEFHGWDMPLWFAAGAVAEHRVVITAAGAFDTSHMSILTVTGPGAFELLQFCFTRDLTACAVGDKGPLNPGECVFGAFLNEHGHAIDDAVVYRIGSDSFMIVVNAGMGDTIAEHLRFHCTDGDAEVTDLTGRVGKIDLQGPRSGVILGKALRDPDAVLRDLRYFSFRGGMEAGSPTTDVVLAAGTPVIVSRTGYTGEFGFELFVRADNLAATWDAIFAAGKDFGLLPCGLAARDSLRAGAVLPLSRQDIGPWPFINHPWEFVLPFSEDRKAFTKHFLGESVIKERDSADHTLPFVGYDPRKVSIHDSAVVEGPDCAEIGIVLTCVADMAIGRYDHRVLSIASPDRPEDFKPLGLSCGLVKVKERLTPGTRVNLRDSRRTIPVEIVDDVRPARTARIPIGRALSVD
ncbi:MAG: aminomethyltransferase family protein [Desulfomonile sp.]|nr:aminomethyltransferase family protein [Desulfomonile sp.]